MTFAPPTLAQFPDHSAERVSVNLSTLNDDLIVQVPDSADIPANWEIYPILGTNPEEPDWEGQQQPTGIWDDASDEMRKLNGIELRIPWKTLESQGSQEIELRYKFQDESSMEPFSASLLLWIEI